MTASSKFFGAASAIAMSVAMAVPGAAVVSLATVSASEAAVVSRIDVRGNQRVDAQTVRDNINIRPGKTFTSADVDDAVKRLFAMGLFSDVRITQSGNTLIIQVDENPVVNNVIFQGNKKVKDNVLTQAVQLKARSPYDATMMEADKMAIQDAYARVGRNDAIVNARVVDLGQGRVNVVYEITEGGRTKIKSINFVGNSAFGERRLRDVISTKRSNPLSWLTRNDIYDEGRLQADEEALRRFYYNRGYADFQVVSSEAVLDEATNEYTITITVDEGDRYHFGDVEIESSVAGVDTQNLQGLLKTRTGDAYSARDIEATVESITESVAGQGYAFAKVEPRGDRDFSNQTISVVYAVEEGPRAYLERIEIRGNDKTRDFVIRREFDVSEGDAFNQTMVARAKRRLEALGFFQDVNISTAQGSEPDQVVLVVDVIEKPTGEFSIGAGYTSGGETPGATIEGSVAERNFLGRGQFVRFSAGFGENKERNYGFSFTEPYFLGYRMSAGFDVFHRSYRVDHDYDVEQTGGTIRFGLPVTDYFSVGLAYNLVQEKYKLFKSSVNYAPALLDAEKHSPWLRSSVSYSLTYDSIDDRNNPHDGYFGTLTQEFAGLGGDAKFMKTTFRGSAYKTLSQEADIVGVLSGGGGYLHKFTSDGVRMFDMFKNNSDIIRGFKYNGLGRYQMSDNGLGTEKYFVGSTTYFNASAEVQFPMPVIPESLGIRGAVFADAAVFYGGPKKYGGVEVLGDDKKIRSSAGVSLMWASPFGPLRFDYAVPMSKASTDRVQNFNFGVSSKF